ncbi:MFS transporter [Kitasatospora sp. NPDC058162]|uniref:MFS transporter n=1 Tax=Kitasatospora sp. NPDC058162 TaxID=3346362 RepID=UPI0036D84F77
MAEPVPLERRALLQSPDFRRLWAGDSAARLGYQIAQFALPLMAVTLLHVSATKVGLVSASQFVPVIALSLVAGSMVDRISARRLLVVCNLVRGAALGLLGLISALVGLSFWALLLVAVLVGSATVFYDVGYQSTVPRVLSVSELVSGNGLLQATNSVTQMAGPALAGFLVQAAGLPSAVGVTAGLFTAAVLSFWSFGSREEAGERTARPKVSIRDGLRFTLKTRAVRDLCLQSGLYNLHEEAFLTAFMIYAVRTQHVSGGVVGVILGIGSIGALLGSLLAGRLSERLHAGMAVTTALLVAAASFLVGRLAAAVVLPLLALTAAFVINGVASAVYNVFAISLRQAVPPAEYLGSVTASYRLVSFGTIPLGALVGGVLVDWAGASRALLLISISMTVSCCMLFTSPLRRIASMAEAQQVFGTPEDAGDDSSASSLAGRS